jgi:hypothetical protein
LRRDQGYLSAGFGDDVNVESWVAVKSLRKHDFGMGREALFRENTNILDSLQSPLLVV